MVVDERSRGVRRSRQQWRALIERFGASGLSVQAFCRRESISEVSFYRWRKALGGRGAGGALVVQGSAPGFVSLGAVNARPLRERLELELDLGDGVVLHLVRG